MIFKEIQFDLTDLVFPFPDNWMSFSRMLHTWAKYGKAFTGKWGMRKCMYSYYVIRCAIWKSCSEISFSMLASGNIRPICSSIVERIDALCSLMEGNLDVMANLARGGFTLNVKRFLQSTGPFMGKVLFIAPLAAAIRKAAGSGNARKRLP